MAYLVWINIGDSDIGGIVILGSRRWNWKFREIFYKSESGTSVTSKLKFLTLAIYQWQRLGLSKYATMRKCEKLLDVVDWISMLVTSFEYCYPTLIEKDRVLWWPKWPIPSPISYSCHRHISSSTSVTNINVTINMKPHLIAHH